MATSGGTEPSVRCSSSRKHGQGVDADGDGAADPNDLDDAAQTAARYLCADGHDLASRQGWIDAIAGYNHREDYVRAVAEETNRLTLS